MAIIEDVDSDSENDDIEADDDAEESNYAREERDFLARKEAAEAAENLKLRPARAARVALATVHKPPTRRRDWSSNPALNSYLRGNTKIADLPTDGSLTLQEVLKASQEVLTETQADLLDIDALERLVALIGHLGQLEDTQEPDWASLTERAHRLLRIPRHFVLPDYEITSEIAQKQAYWRAGSTAVLSFLQAVLGLAAYRAWLENASRSDQGLLIGFFAKFTPFVLAPSVKQSDDVPWSSPLSAKLASSNLFALLELQSCPPRVQLVRRILLERLKPLFAQTPHKNIHPETGRKLPRQRGGDQFSDSWAEPLWKGKTDEGEEASAVGCWKVLQYCLTLLEGQDYEDIWPAVVPPLMTLLDDHETRYRVQGVACLGVLLDRVPASLLKKTGLSSLVQTALTTTYSFTSEVDNIPMIRASFDANIKLIDLLWPAAAADGAQTTPKELIKSNGSRKAPENPEMERFEAHSSIYRNLILSIFAFHSSSVPLATLAFQTLTVIVERHGIGCLRFIGDTMPVLTAALGASHAGKGLVMLFSSETVLMYQAALDAILALYAATVGSERMARWRGSILASLGILWCNIVEGEGLQAKEQRADMAVLQESMQRVVHAIRKEGPEAQADIGRLRACDPVLFADLFETEGA